MFIVKRNPHNPIIKPRDEHHWSSVATFNWSPIKLGDKYHAFYRAMAKPDYLHGPNLSLSTIGVAESDDGIHYENHKQLIVPDHEWEMYGCEDPRATSFDGLTYVFYTALSIYPFSHEGIRAAVAISDDCRNIIEKHEITPFNAKAMCLFPEKVNGKYLALLTINPDMPPAHICFAEFEKLEDMWNPEYWRYWHASYEKYKFNLLREDGQHVEIGAPPIKTEKGWLLIYSHIYNYFTENDKIFGVEAVLLDLDDPKRIIGRSNYPFLVPETYYERKGEVPNIVFPSGAMVEDQNQLKIYYGGADTVCCLAETNIDDLVNSIDSSGYREAVDRYDANPILKPREDHTWEGYAVFNPAAIELDGKIHIFYRAMGYDNTSKIGYAVTSDGYSIDERLDEPAYVPRADFEQKKNGENCYSGCEDPRVTRIGDKVYMAYTAYDGLTPPKIAITDISVEDILKKNWNWSMPQLISPVDMDDKDSCLFPEMINGNYVVMHRMKSVVCIDYVPDLNFEEHKLDRCIQLFGPRKGMWDGEKVGIAGPPMKTDEGWLLLYHGVSSDKYYRIGAVLLEMENPANVIARTADYIFEPREDYEMKGQVDRVVFPCGAVIRDDKVFIYYGGADSVIGVATVDYEKLMRGLLG